MVEKQSDKEDMFIKRRCVGDKGMKDKERGRREKEEAE